MGEVDLATEAVVPSLKSAQRIVRLPVDGMEKMQGAGAVKMSYTFGTVIPGLALVDESKTVRCSYLNKGSHKESYWDSQCWWVEAQLYACGQ